MRAQTIAQCLLVAVFGTVSLGCNDQQQGLIDKLTNEKAVLQADLAAANGAATEAKDAAELALAAEKRLADDATKVAEEAQAQVRAADLTQAQALAAETTAKEQIAEAQKTMADLQKQLNEANAKVAELETKLKEAQKPEDE